MTPFPEEVEMLAQATLGGKGGTSYKLNYTVKPPTYFTSERHIQANDTLNFTPKIEIFNPLYSNQTLIKFYKSS
jgi:hypothetical protein